MPVDASIPLQAQTPNPLGSISGLLNIQQQQQAIQGQQSANAAAAAQAAQAQQDLQERAAATHILKNQDKLGFLDENGVTDPAKLIPAILKAAPKTGGQYIEPIMNGFRAQTEVNQAAQNLSRSQREDVNGGLSAVAADPDSTYKDVVDTADLIKEQNPKAAKTVNALLSHLNPNDPMDVTRHKLVSFGRTILPATEITGTGGLVTPVPSSMDNGAVIQPGAANRQTGAFTPAGAPIKKSLGPGMSILTDQSGAQFAFNPQTNTVTPVGTGRSGVAPGAAPSQPTFRQPSYPGQNQDIESYRGEVQSVRAEAQQAPLARNINQQILRLTQDAKTGPGSDTWQHVIGAVGTPFGLSPTASYQEVGKFLEKNAIASMQAMGGPPSDSRLDAAAKANGSTSFSPEALRTVTKFNDATTTALDQYRQGIDHAVGVGGNVDYTKLPAFKAAWAKNFDVNVFRVENAIRDGDQEELAKIKRELGPKGLKALAEKRKNLTLLTEGQTP